MVASGGAVAGNIWHTATHAEHARPMMQASCRGEGAGVMLPAEWAGQCRSEQACLHAAVPLMPVSL